MAIRYYGVNVGGQAPVDVTISASTTSSDVELAVDDTNIAVGLIDKRMIILEAIEALKLAVEQDSP